MLGARQARACGRGARHASPGVPDWRAILSIYWFQEVPRAGFDLPAQTVAVDEEETHARFALGEWAFSSRDAVDSDRMDDHLAWLADATIPLLSALRASSSGSARITCTWARAVDNASITIPAMTLVPLTTLNADLAFDLMTAQDDD